jgi:hypothetical protein
MQQRKPYSSPKLTTYGEVRNLTAGGTTGGNEYLTVMIFVWTVMTCSEDMTLTSPSCPVIP